MPGVLYEDIFEVRKLNPDGKKFDRVNRLECRGLTYEMDLLLDTNCEIFPLKEGDRISFVIADTLDLNGKPDDGTFKPLGEETSHLRHATAKMTKMTTLTYHDCLEQVMHGRMEQENVSLLQRPRLKMTFGLEPPASLADKYEYVMHGRVFRSEYENDARVQVYASFGGLLMRLAGEQRHVANVEVDSRVFCLLRKNA